MALHNPPGGTSLMPPPFAALEGKTVSVLINNVGINHPARYFDEIGAWC